MFYVSRGRRVLHSRPDCVKNCSPTLHVPGENGFRACKRCALQKVCVICMESNDANIRSCGEHFVCAECLECFVIQNAENPVWDGALLCPCGATERFDTDHIAPLVKALCNAVATQQQHSHSAVDDVEDCVRRLTPSCPVCRAAFYDFDGCAVLSCNQCKVLFCAWCDHTFDRADEAHRHVVDCESNPVPQTLYPTSDAWLEFKAAKARRTVIDAICAVYRRNGSYLQALGFAAALRSRGVAVLELLLNV